MKTILGMTLVVLLGGLLQPQVSAKTLSSLNDNEANWGNLDELRDKLIWRSPRQAPSMNEPMEESTPVTLVDPTPPPHHIPTTIPATSTNSDQGDDDDCSEEDSSGDSDTGLSISYMNSGNPIINLIRRIFDMGNNMRSMAVGMVRGTGNMVRMGAMEGEHMMEYMLSPIWRLMCWVARLINGIMKTMWGMVTLPQQMLMGRSKRDVSDVSNMSNANWENSLVSLVVKAWNEIIRMSRCLISPQNEQEGCQKTLQNVSHFVQEGKNLWESLRKAISSGSYKNPQMGLENAFRQGLAWIDDNSPKLEQYGVLSAEWASQLHTLRNIIQLLVPMTN